MIMSFAKSTAQEPDVGIEVNFEGKIALITGGKSVV